MPLAPVTSTVAKTVAPVTGAFTTPLATVTKTIAPVTGALTVPLASGGIVAKSVAPVTGGAISLAPVTQSLAPAARTVAGVAEVPPWERWATQLAAGIASVGASSLSAVAGGFARPESGLRGGGRAVAPAPGSPAPAPSGSPFGTGVDSAAGGGSGFFFFGVAGLDHDVAALFVPRVIGTLRLFGRSLAPEPFVLLLERPG